MSCTVASIDNMEKKSTFNNVVGKLFVLEKVLCKEESENTKMRENAQEKQMMTPWPNANHILNVNHSEGELNRITLSLP